MRDDDGRRTPDHGHPISSPCEPNGSGELKTLRLYITRGCFHYGKTKYQVHCKVFVPLMFQHASLVFLPLALSLFL